MENKKLLQGKFKIYLLIVYVWFGFISTQIAHRMGGAVAILLGYVLLVMVLFPGRIYFERDEKEITRAIGCYCIFVFLYILMTETLVDYEEIKSFGGINMNTSTYHALKSFPYIISFLLLLRKEETRTDYCWVVLVLVLIDMLLTLRALEKMPMVARYLATGNESKKLLPFKLAGAMGYELTYSVTLLIPLVFVYGFTHRRWIFCAMAALAVVYVWRCNYMLAVLLMILNAGLVFVFRIRKKHIRWLVTIAITIAAIAIVSEKNTIGEFFMNLSRRMDTKVFRTKLEDLARAILYGDTSGDALNRVDLYMQDVSGILASPIIGSELPDSYFQSGGHSTILGLWGSFGLPVLIPFLLIFWNIYKHTIKGIQLPIVRATVSAAYLTFLIMSVFNPVLAEPLIPICVLWVIPNLAKSVAVVEEERKQRRRIRRMWRMQP